MSSTGRNAHPLGPDAAAVRAEITALMGFNRHDLALDLSRRAFAAGYDPLFAIDIAALIWDKNGSAAADQAAARLLEELPGITFSFQNAAFYLVDAAKALNDIRSLIAYENATDDSAVATAAGLRDHARALIWPRIWQLSRLQDTRRLGRMAVLYPLVYARDPQQTLVAVEAFFSTYGLWDAALAALTDMALVPETPAALVAQRLAWLVQTHLNLREEADAHAAFIALFKMLSAAGLEDGFANGIGSATIRGLLFTYNHISASVNLPGIESLLEPAKRLLAWLELDDRPGTYAAAYQQVVMLLAHIHEDLGNEDEAERLCLIASDFSPDGYLSDQFWRCSVFLSARGRWSEAAKIQQAGVITRWPTADVFATVPGGRRYETDAVLPHRAVVLNTDGIGDDLWRVIMMIRLSGPTARYAFVVDDRLQQCLERALPEHEFIVRSRGAGRDAVPVELFHRDRIGVPRAADYTRITRPIMDKIAEYGEVSLSEDVIAEYFRREGRYEFAFDRPYLVPSDADRALARNWVATLPADNINVGICWRSGVASAFRDRGHFRIDQIGPILCTPGVTWIDLQYFGTQAEIDFAAREYGVVLRTMPGLDLKDDIEKVVGLVTALDLVVCAPSTVEPLAAASGTPVITIAPGYDSISQYRVSEDGETDRALGNITMLTARRYGSKAAIAAEASARIAKWRERLRGSSELSGLADAATPPRRTLGATPTRSGRCGCAPISGRQPVVGDDAEDADRCLRPPSSGLPEACGERGQ